MHIVHPLFVGANDWLEELFASCDSNLLPSRKARGRFKSPFVRTSGKLPPPIIGWRQQRSEPYHTRVGFGFIFINCTNGKEDAHSASSFPLIRTIGSHNFLQVAFRQRISRNSPSSAPLILSYPTARLPTGLRNEAAVQTRWQAENPRP